MKFPIEFESSSLPMTSRLYRYIVTATMRLYFCISILFFFIFGIVYVYMDKTTAKMLKTRLLDKLQGISTE